MVDEAREVGLHMSNIWEGQRQDPIDHNTLTRCDFKFSPQLRVSPSAIVWVTKADSEISLGIQTAEVMTTRSGLISKEGGMPDDDTKEFEPVTIGKA